MIVMLLGALHLILTKLLKAIEEDYSPWRLQRYQAANGIIDLSQ